GGHSLLATQVLSQVSRAFNQEVPLRALFEAPTVARLAAYIATGRETGGARAVPDLIPRDRGADAPLSFAQQRFWFIDQLSPGTCSYNLVSAFRLRGPLDVGALERGLQQIVARHETLRSSFQSRPDGPFVVIAPGSASVL